jgi:hypothetical protein
LFVDNGPLVAANRGQVAELVIKYGCRRLLSPRACLVALEHQALTWREWR